MARKREEPVRLTRIYTGGGDAGETSLGDGTRVSKTHPRIDTYGTVDELNATIGFVVAADPPAPMRGWLVRIQNELFDLGADLSVPGDDPGCLRIVPEQSAWLERCCDEENERLEPLRSFVLPGGTELAARLHMARTVCRRAERLAVALAASESVNPSAMVYLNRLSDLLFILSRAANHAVGAGEPLWVPGASR